MIIILSYLNIWFFLQNNFCMGIRIVDNLFGYYHRSILVYRYRKEDLDFCVDLDRLSIQILNFHKLNTYRYRVHKHYFLTHILRIYILYIYIYIYIYNDKYYRIIEIIISTCAFSICINTISTGRRTYLAIRINMIVKVSRLTGTERRIVISILSFTGDTFLDSVFAFCTFRRAGYTSISF